MLFSDYDDDVKTDKCIRRLDIRVVYMCVHFCAFLAVVPHLSFCTVMCIGTVCAII